MVYSDPPWVFKGRSVSLIAKRCCSVLMLLLLNLAVVSAVNEPFVFRRALYQLQLVKTEEVRVDLIRSPTNNMME